MDSDIWRVAVHGVSKSWTNSNEFEQAPGDSEEQKCLHATVHGVTKSRTQLRD